MDMKQYIYGTFGGMFGTLLSHPIDTYRINKQTNNIINFKQLYKGLTPPLIGIGLEKSLVFGTFYSLESNNYTTNLPIFIKGTIAGFISTLVVSPVEYIKINLQTNNKNIFNIKNVYKGWSATIFREVPGYGLYFYCYENLKRENDKMINTFWKGSLSGLFAWTFIYPSDYVKTIVQNKNFTYKQSIKYILGKSNNPLHFYKGCSYALIRCIPLHGGVFLGYEFIKNNLKLS